MKLTGGTGLRTAGITGLTIASENPVYVEGNYNVGDPAAYATEPHIGAGIIADAIVLLSSAWNDINSFYDSPHDVPGNSKMDSAAVTSYRFAAVAGKSISFQRATATAWTPETDFGNDGGAHNLLRMLEDWGSRTLNYRGSIVSFFISRQATGIYKAGQYSYGAPTTRNFNFDVDFLLPDKLPPGTPCSGRQYADVPAAAASEPVASNANDKCRMPNANEPLWQLAFGIWHFASVPFLHHPAH